MTEAIHGQEQIPAEAVQAFEGAGLGAAPASAETVSPAGGVSSSSPPPTVGAGQSQPADSDTGAAAAAPAWWQKFGYADPNAAGTDFEGLMQRTQQYEQKLRQYEIEKAQWEARQASASEFEKRNAPKPTPAQLRKMEEIFPTAPGAKTAGWLDAMGRDPQGWMRTMLSEMVRGDQETQRVFSELVNGAVEPKLQPLNQFVEGYGKNYQQYQQQTQQQQFQQKLEQSRNYAFNTWAASKPEYAAGTPAHQAMVEHYRQNAQFYDALIVQGKNPFEYHAPLVAQAAISGAQLAANNQRLQQMGGLRAPARPGAAATVAGAAENGLKGAKAVLQQHGLSPMDVEMMERAFSDKNLT